MNTQTKKDLPWVCPDHPKAQIRHTWDRTQYYLNQYPAGTPMDSAHRYECAECGRQLATPSEACKKAEVK